jgi:hypothetical protein
VQVIQTRYKNVTYHNKTHGADLCQTINVFLELGGLAELTKVDSYEKLAILIAAAVHDFEHPGVNNVFLTKIQDPIAIRHNDQSVLESHHIAAAFEVMLGDPNNNWAVKFEQSDFIRVRQLMINCVLATDMSHHFKELNNLKTKTGQSDWSLSNEENKQSFLKFCFHLADISNPVKKWAI